MLLRYGDATLRLMNYRCFGSDEQTILIDNLTTFIGNNSAGKTAALSALNCLFSENSGNRILQRSDFHLPKELTPDEMESQNLYVEAVFEFEELKAENGSEYAIPIFFQHLVVDNPAVYHICGFVLKLLRSKAARLKVQSIAK